MNYSKILLHIGKRETSLSFVTICLLLFYVLEQCLLFQSLVKIYAANEYQKINVSV